MQYKGTNTLIKFLVTVAPIMAFNQDDGFTK